MQRCKEGIHSSKLRVWLAAIFVLVLLPVAVSAEEGVVAGDAAKGKKLFTGERSFENGGPPCMSCHNASVGALGGGSLGPDLTKIMANEDKSILLMAEWINDEGTPVMGPVFSKHEVTEQEVEDLKAFLTVQGPKRIKTGGVAFAGGGIAGCVAIIIAFSVIWGGRYRSRNKGTAHEAMWRNYGGKGGV